MRIVYFTHALTSCWNHANAHFLRGVLRELIALGHAVEAYEPADSWSRANLLRDHGPAGLAASLSAHPELSSETYAEPEAAAERAAGADLVVAHQWNDPALIAALGRVRGRGAIGALLFHDTHHRAADTAEERVVYDLSGFDGVLAFGAALAEVYRAAGWGPYAFVWHEGADIRLFHPMEPSAPRKGIVWVGNWGGDARTEELDAYLFRPAQAAGIPVDVHGTRYPAAAVAALTERGARYRGWAPNAAVPGLFAAHCGTVHVPRRHDAEMLPGIPTIRVFEALASGIPLACAPWVDAEGLFTPGADYLVARDPEAMAGVLRALCRDAGLREALAAHGLATIRARHTCRHRADELVGIAERLGVPAAREAAS